MSTPYREIFLFLFKINNRYYLKANIFMRFAISSPPSPLFTPRERRGALVPVRAHGKQRTIAVVQR